MEPHFNVSVSGAVYAFNTVFVCEWMDLPHAVFLDPGADLRGEVEGQEGMNNGLCKCYLNHN